MGRLIDADVVKQELYQQWFMDILLTQTRSDNMFYALSQKIDEIPTAYDPDKVVEQLDEVAFERYGNDGMGGERVVNLDDVIGIVRGGGVDG